MFTMNKCYSKFENEHTHTAFHRLPHMCTCQHPHMKLENCIYAISYCCSDYCQHCHHCVSIKQAANQSFELLGKPVNKQAAK